MAYPVITIAREYGSGGRIIGQKLAQKLVLPFYDKELISLAAKESGLAEEFIRTVEQKRNLSFLYNLYSNLQMLPASDQVFLAQCQVIREIAEKGPCVIVGRCADYALRERKDCLNVFIHAPLAERIARARDVYGDDASDVENTVLKRDKDRANYYGYFTFQKWSDPHNYHIAIDSGIGLDIAVSLLAELAEHFMEVCPNA